MKYRAHVAALVCLALFVFNLEEARSQGSTPFEQLQSTVRAGDAVSVTETSGQVSRGRISELSQSSIRLVVNGMPRDIPQRAVLEIRQRQRDSLANGTRNGAIVGGVIGILPAILATSQIGTGAGVAFAGIFVGMGAGIGLGIDALMVRTRVIYRSGRPIASRFRVTPILQSSNRGFRLSMSF